MPSFYVDEFSRDFRSHMPALYSGNSSGAEQSSVCWQLTTLLQALCVIIDIDTAV